MKINVIDSVQWVVWCM